MANSLAIPPPPTPVMLYVGAGYDLSPLLIFAPGGPPYPILPLSAQPEASVAGPSKNLLGATAKETYTSFLFVDAKPRHTSAFMVDDFEEWRDVADRVRNIMRYSQGKLDRYRVVDAPYTRHHSPSSNSPRSPSSSKHADPSGDLIWFEGGGDPAHIMSRHADPTWHFVQPSTTPSLPSSSRKSSSQPLTTLLYLFNTLDVELAPNPYLTGIWPRVEALYVHGLKLWRETGLVPVMYDSVDRVGSPNAGDWDEPGLKRCYVIVGSWGTPRRNVAGARTKGKGKAMHHGIRDVDFVRARRHRRAGSRRKGDVKRTEESLLVHDEAQSLSIKRLVPPPPHASFSSSGDTSSSPLVFRRPRLYSRSRPSHLSLSSGTTTTTFDTDAEIDAEIELQPWWDNAWEEPVACADRVKTLAGAFGRCTSTSSGSRRLSLDFGPPFPVATEESLAISDTHGANSTPGFSSAWSDSPFPSVQALSPLTPPPSRPHATTSIPLPLARNPFHIRIPQFAWLDTVNEGRGGYYITKTVEESLEVWRAREGANEETEEEQSAWGESGDEDLSEGEGQAQERQQDECACKECAAESKATDVATGAKNKVMEFLRVRSTSSARRPLTAPPRLRLQPRSPAPAPSPLTRTRSTPERASDTTSLSNSASETEVSEDEHRDEAEGPISERAMARTRGAGFWRWRRSVSAVPLSLFSSGTGTPTRTGVNRNVTREVVRKNRSRSGHEGERRISMSDFLGTTSFAQFAPSGSSRSTPSSPRHTRPFKFPRSPYGPMNLDHPHTHRADETRSASCPDLKDGVGDVRKCKSAAEGTGAGVSSRTSKVRTYSLQHSPKRARTLSGLRFTLPSVLSMSFGRKSGTPTTSSSPLRTPASPATSVSPFLPASAPPHPSMRVPRSESSPLASPIMNSRSHHARSTSSPNPSRGFRFRFDPDAPPVPPLPAHIPAFPSLSSNHAAAEAPFKTLKGAATFKPKHKPTPTPKPKPKPKPIHTPAAKPSWDLVGWLFGEPQRWGEDVMGVESAESDATRVGDY